VSIATRKVEDLASIIRIARSLRIGAPNMFRLECPETESVLDLSDFNQIISFEPADQLVSMQTGITLLELNSFLRQRGFEIPLGRRDEDQDETVGDLMALNLPHPSSHAVGSWRDWVVRMNIVLASGEVVISGANVVKNVTGFDLHKLMIGARYTIGVPVEATLRIRPFLGPKYYDSYQALAKEVSISDITETHQKLMKRTKEIFDPTHKLNPGEFGFI
jgi:FAD/FMN-containing dehydrogenase